MANTLELPCDVGNVSDGYHTFKELYEHRCTLFVLFLNQNPDNSFKTWYNDVGEKYDGWFIAGYNSEYGQITYHLPEHYWQLLNVKIKVRNNDYDGHSSEDVLVRLKKIILKDVKEKN